TFAPKAAFLDAAEGSDFRGDETGVDADHAGFQRFGDAPDAAYIARGEVGGQTKRRGVAHRDDVGLVLEADHRRERAEGFLLRHQRVRLDVGEHRGLEEGASELATLA